MKIIAYYRVSTRKQEASGLGLEGQQFAVANFAKANGGEIVATFTEIESGKVSSRPEIAKAITEAKRLGARLVIAKLDRLARNVHFVSGLMESGVEFTACDSPHASRLTLHVLASVAENEARSISDRTKAALAALKARGVRLGSPVAAATAPEAAKANARKAAAFAETIRPLAQRKREAGKSLQEIADYLTGRGLRTRRGGAWSATAVMRLLA
ncbi:recombinase family protein [Lacipirellula sp.]|uniref:recombinase family protein n=1 Tax=Lacipirellula sp. TaxID=2691419 RepID=UPI003D0D8544